MILIVVEIKPKHLMNVKKCVKSQIDVISTHHNSMSLIVSQLRHIYLFYAVRNVCVFYNGWLQRLLGATWKGRKVNFAPGGRRRGFYKRMRMSSTDSINRKFFIAL